MTPTSTPTRVGPPADASPAGPTEPDLLRRGRAILREVLRLVDERAGSELKVESTRASNDAKADAEYARARQALAEKYERLDREARSADEARRRAIVDAALAGESQAKGEFSSSSRRIASEFDVQRAAAQAAYHRAKVDAETTHAAAAKKANRAHADEIKPIHDAGRSADAVRERLASLAATYQRYGLGADLPAAVPEKYAKFDDPLFELITRIARIDAPLKLLEGLVIPKLTRGWGWLGLALAAAMLPVGLAWWMEAEWVGLVAAGAAGIALAVALRVWLARLTGLQLRRFSAPVAQSLADADALALHCRALADARLKEATRLATARRDEELTLAKRRHVEAIAAAEAGRDEKIRTISDAYAARMTDVQTTQQRDLRSAIDLHDRRMADLPAQSAASFMKLEAQYLPVKEQIRARHQSAWLAMAERWRSGMQRAAADLDEVRVAVESLDPEWDDPAWKDRQAPRAEPSVVRFGTARLDLAALPQGIAADPRLMEGVPTTFAFPALRAFPDRANLLVESPADGRSAAMTALQTAMYRLLTSLPPGKVRFTIVDSSGLGRPFGAFMHLADFDPDLVGHQVWTDPRQIDEKLSELVAHMEGVTQKYLRNEYATIEEYNAVAGEVAEPYRVLVVADFPGKFEEGSSARLAAIAAGGVPCGVITLIAADPSRPMPADFDLSAFRSHCLRLRWAGPGLAWDDPDFGRYPLVPDPPLPAEFATSQIQTVGASALTARRVEVPFEYIAPPAEEWWTRDSRSGVDVALGKAGATKRQHLALGKGTSQHVLIAGRTGSGKSTLMHALITNVALNYGPDEVELYLIDFKKGVEFKVYATQELPHARVIAIESEREFGISVLQRIDSELRLRADRFREAGVQDIQGFRNLAGSPPLPRILLIVDEFQEFFVEEDKLAQDAASLLDRIVRQGRAFGVHVHLGSQSLTGANALARSTLGQMAIRIALQCSEIDSHLILSEQNPAARMLSRPGEAIYNDANGAPEGNHFFQVVWLTDERRESYLKQIRDLARQRPPRLPREQIVFEGDAPADLSRNALLGRLLDAPGWPESPRAASAWLGEAIAIKDPTSAVFRRQGGNHLLIVGQQEEAALGLMSSILLSLTAQYPPATSSTARSGARFFVLDGTPEGNPLADSLAHVVRGLPHGVTVGGWRDVPGVLAEMHSELQRRKDADGGDGPDLYLLIHDLPNFRDLRRKEDDYSFSRKEEKASPADHLDAILREGPRLGLHVIAWCDTVNNLNRYFTHQVLREWEMRVYFQMSPSDSGHLLDSPLASKLGPNRAMFVSEDQNRVEKFRPYGTPGEGSLLRIADRLEQFLFDSGG